MRIEPSRRALSFVGREAGSASPPLRGAVHDELSAADGKPDRPMPPAAILDRSGIPPQARTMEGPIRLRLQDRDEPTRIEGRTR